MAVIISFPENLCFSSNVAPLVVASGVACNFVLKKNGVEILNDIYYPDNTGIFNVDLKDIVDSVLIVDIPSGVAFTQNNAVATFTLYIDAQLVHTFVAVKSGVDGVAPLAINFFKANFLTWQPQVLKVKHEDNQYLTYYAVENIVVKAKFYYYVGSVLTTQTVTYGSYTSGKCYSFNMKYSYLRSKANPTSIKPMYIEVWIENATATRLSYIQRYQLTDIYTRFDDCFMFVNSLGGVDNIRFDGWMEARDEHKISSAVFNKVRNEYDLEFNRLYSKNTGFLPSEDYRRWALDFFCSVERYHISGGLNKRILVDKFDTKNVVAEVNDFSFDFAYAEKEKFEIYSRLSDLPVVNDDELVVAPAYVAPVVPPTPFTFGQSFGVSFKSINYSKTIQ